MATKSEIQAAREYRARRRGPVDPTLRLLVEFTDSESQAAVKLSKAKGWRGYRVAGARLATGMALAEYQADVAGFTAASFDSGKLPVHTLKTGEAVASLPASAGARVFASPRDLEGVEVVIWWLIEEDLERVRSARMIGWLTAIEIRERPLRPGKFGDQWSIRVEDLRRGGPRWSGKPNVEEGPRADPSKLALSALERSRDACADAIGDGVWVHMTPDRSEIWELREGRKDGEPAHRLVKVVNHSPNAEE
ncbi:MAG: hypothetical protein GY772_26350 [bacterium]|nr:hypothetical protein [bacterium]